jgi:hypothetical protein
MQVIHKKTQRANCFFSINNRGLWGSPCDYRFLGFLQGLGRPGLLITCLYVGIKWFVCCAFFWAFESSPFEAGAQIDSKDQQKIKCLFFCGFY